jgi:putative PIN family toxin of toxin-antitoxin system
MRPRIVVDTNVYVSRLLRPSSVPGKAVARAWLEATTLVSSATLMELEAVLGRAKFAPYIHPGSLELFLKQLRSIADLIQIVSTIRACRDPHDDKFLEVAVDGRADLIVTGDQDLLALHPFHGIDLLTPAEYLRQQ